MASPIDGRDRFREALDIVGNVEHREAVPLVTDVRIEIHRMHYEILAFNRGYPTHPYCPVIQHPPPDLEDRAVGVTDQVQVLSNNTWRRWHMP